MYTRTACVNGVCRIEYQLPGGPWRYGCEPASVGEFWHDDYLTSLLQVAPTFRSPQDPNQNPNSHNPTLNASHPNTLHINPSSIP